MLCAAGAVSFLAIAITWWALVRRSLKYATLCVAVGFWGVSKVCDSLSWCRNINCEDLEASWLTVVGVLCPQERSCHTDGSGSCIRFVLLLSLARMFHASCVHISNAFLKTAVKDERRKMFDTSNDPLIYSSQRNDWVLKIIYVPEPTMAS